MELGIVRLVAALAVLFSHSYALTGNGAVEPLTRLTEGRISLGEAAVYVFFGLSGYLVTQSWLRDPSVIRYMLRRSLRIFPALVFVILCSVLIIGPLTTVLDVGSYFRSRETWTYLSKIFIYPRQYGLSGVFKSNPFPGVVNGSLWSLRLEFALYIFIAILGRMGILRRRIIGIAGIAVSAIVSAILVPIDTPSIHQLTILFLNATPFFVGVLLAQGRKMVSRPMARFNDYSYGIYLWAFPIQQTLINFVPGINSTNLLLISLPIVVGLAMISWHLIERRAMSFKPYSG